MEENRKIIDEQIEKLQKYNDYLKKRNSKLSQRNKMHERTIQKMGTESRTQSRVNDELKDILFSVSRGIIDYYSLGIFMRWVNDIVLDNEKLKEEKKMLHPFTMISTSRVKLWITEN